MAILIDGKAVAARKMEELKQRVDALNAKGKCPSLRVVQVGNDPASTVSAPFTILYRVYMVSPPRLSSLRTAEQPFQA